MSYNNELTTQKTSGFVLPTMLEGDFSSEDLADDSEGLRLSFQRVKIPGGGTLQFEMAGDDPENPDYMKNIEGVIVFSHPTGAYWPEGTEYDDSVTPLCSSYDGKTGYGAPGGSCELCDMNKYGTAVDSKGNPTKGKACKNMRHLYILRSGDYMPILLTLPPTSLRPYNDFVNAAFMSRRRPTYTGVVQIGLKREENGSNQYSVATFCKVADFCGEELAQIKAYAAEFRAQAKAMLRERAEAASQSESEDLYSAADYHFSDSGDHFEISAAPTIDGDREELPA